MVLALVGMPGSGKSSVGRQLARKLGVGFVDTDQVIELRMASSIREFFQREGEQAFRDIETQVIHDMTRTGCGVLATGGGAVLREVNRSVLRERTHVIYLRVSPDELFRRLRHDTQRPLLQVNDPKAKLRELFEQREPCYQAAAHYVIETSRPRVATMVNMIMSQLELAGLLPMQPPAT
ncbi:MAG: shikimate kinase [Betaproteobacteria bacterium]|nr:shikimate kinase [Betaproteobacteria bacterium]